MRRIADCRLPIADCGLDNPKSKIRNPQCRVQTVLLGAFCIGALLCCAALAQACPGCKEALFDPAQAQQAVQRAKGMNASIGLLLGMPLLLLGGVATSILRASRRAKRLGRTP